MLKFDKIKYPDGIGYCIYRTLKDENDFGLCFDIEEEEIDEAILTLQKAREAESVVYEPDLEWENHKKKIENLEKKWWYQIHQKLEDIAIQISPFDWEFRKFMTSRVIPRKDGTEYVHKLCNGFKIGPLTITF